MMQPPNMQFGNPMMNPYMTGMNMGMNMPFGGNMGMYPNQF